jgi:hypothetical protein
LLEQIPSHQFNPNRLTPALFFCSVFSHSPPPLPLAIGDFICAPSFFPVKRRVLQLECHGNKSVFCTADSAARFMNRQVLSSDNSLWRNFKCFQFVFHRLKQNTSLDFVVGKNEAQKFISSLSKNLF